MDKKANLLRTFLKTGFWIPGRNKASRQVNPTKVFLVAKTALRENELSILWEGSATAQYVVYLKMLTDGQYTKI
ncbi:MAG TPA: hypothetical protein VKR53_10355 [Puia sp.]|nr:hypothetical protein [Puia sp.]